MNLPRTGDRIDDGGYPFGETLLSLHDAVRAHVEAALGDEYRVVEIQATMRTTYQRPEASQGEIHPAHIPPFFPVPEKLEFAVHAVKVTTVYRPDWIDVTVDLMGDALIVRDVSIGKVY